MAAAPEPLKDIRVLRETCLDSDTCRTDACNPNECRTYRTQVSVERVKTTRLQDDAVFIRCKVTGQEVGPFNPKEIDVHNDSFKFAGELGVRPKDVWKSLIDNSIGKTIESPGEAQCFDENGKFIPKLLADVIMEEHNFLTMMDNEEIYVYVDGYYQPLGEILVKKECRQRLQGEYRKNRAAEVIEFIKTSTYSRRREEESNLVPLENGVLNLDTMKLESLSPEFQFFNKIPVKYDPKAKCPNIEKFLREIVNGEEDVTLLDEIAGFCLYRNYFIAKALMLVGNGANGKSTWLSLIKRFLGIENVSGRSLQDLEEHRFAKADLHAKLANIYADLPDQALRRTGMFKMLTGRDLISAEHKFQQSFHFVNYAKLLFSANKVPEAYDDTSAFFRRWIIVVFPNEFVGDDADPQILEKLTTEEELSGLLNKVLSALKRLLESGRFSHSKTTEEVKEDYIRKSSPIAAFVMDCLEADSDAFIEKKALYGEFAIYCRERSLPTVVQDTFFKNLPQYVVINDFRPRIEGKGRFTSFKGIRYKADGWSGQSSRSKVFFTLVEKRQEYVAPYSVVKIGNSGYIKIELTLDTVDRPDQGTLYSALSLGEKLSRIREWIYANKDADNLIDALDLAAKIREEGLDPQSIVPKLKSDAVLFDVRQPGKFGVIT